MLSVEGELREDMSVLSVECELREDARSRWNILNNNAPSRPRDLIRMNKTMKGRSSLLEIGFFFKSLLSLKTNDVGFFRKITLPPPARGT